LFETKKGAAAKRAKKQEEEEKPKEIKVVDDEEDIPPDEEESKEEKKGLLTKQTSIKDTSVKGLPSEPGTPVAPGFHRETPTVNNPLSSPLLGSQHSAGTFSFYKILFDYFEELFRFVTYLFTCLLVTRI
jgi:hypothetical protein